MSGIGFVQLASMLCALDWDTHTHSD